MNKLYIASAIREDRRVYLPDYVGITKRDVERKVMNIALYEGYKGTLEARLAELGWDIVHIAVEKL